MCLYIYIHTSDLQYLFILHYVAHTMALVVSGQEPEGMNRPLPLTSWSPGRL